MGFRVTRKDIGSYWLNLVVRRCVLKMALPHLLHTLPSRNAGRRRKDGPCRRVCRGVAGGREEGWTDLPLHLWGREETSITSLQSGLA